MTKYIITHIKNRMFTAKFENDVCVELKPVSADYILGNIYIARVENVVKNINSAFVEIQKGVKCYYSLSDNKRPLFLNRKNNNAVNQGDLLLVQVSAESIKSKPATASDKITLTGKYVVLSTDVDGVSVSKKIQGNNHSKSLKLEIENNFNFNVLENIEEIAHNQRYIGQYGFILRTNSADAETSVVLAEANMLVEKFLSIVKSALYGQAFTNIYKAMPIYLEEILDIKTEELQEVITDVEEIYGTITDTVPLDIKNKIRLYSDNLLSLKSLYSLEKELEHALNTRIWLPCGGYLVIEQTEALTVVDVNTGKFVTSKGSDEAKDATILKANMEAAKEIARQLRLRNISGIIIIDFINMRLDEHIAQLVTYLKTCLKADNKKSSVVDITKLGLVEMTRQKGDKSLKEMMENNT